MPNRTQSADTQSRPADRSSLTIRANTRDGMSLASFTYSVMLARLTPTRSASPTTVSLASRIANRILAPRLKSTICGGVAITAAV